MAATPSLSLIRSLLYAVLGCVGAIVMSMYIELEPVTKLAGVLACIFGAVAFIYLESEVVRKAMEKELRKT
ncbi:MAG: hypothetical protein DRJ40_03735 [Thermoprotei archaeon]|nr:MAG: hypothetical protein DRJ40_03735 [Thermoprotei archaeon]